MRAYLPFFVVLLAIVSPVLAAIHFPELTGRVVDNAHILSQSTISSLSQTLEEYENGTSNQLVVVTLPSLEGNTIEDYGYQLGRHWQIGQKGKDNGVLLIVAPNERKVRIEVGYGLEGVLTDAISSQIIQTIILPDFRNKDMEKGVVEGTQAIISVLGGKGVPSYTSGDVVSIIEALFVWLFLFWFIRFAMRHPFIAAYILANSNSRFGSSRMGGGGWSGGGGFSGGGGSFGGGGASGSW